MTDYTQAIDFGDKDALATGNPLKRIKGTEVDSELTAIALAIASKYDSGDLASQVQAEAGALNTVLMTPLRSFQSQAAYLLTGRVVPDGALSTNVPLLNAANTFTTSSNALTFGLISSAAVPGFMLRATGQSANAKVWRNYVSAAQWTWDIADDAGTGQVTWMTATRSGATVASIGLAATTITLNGVSAADYARLSVDNTFTSDVQTIKGTSTSAYPRWVVTNSAGGRKLELGYTGSAASPVYGESADTSWLNAQGGFTLSIADTAALVIDSSRNFNFKGGTVTTNNASASEPGYKGVPVNGASDNYTLILTDAGKTLLQSGSGKTFTIPANASVAYPIGTVLTFVAYGVTTTIAITSDTMYLAGTSSTGSRTLTSSGGIAIATALKVQAAVWVISGSGLS